MANSEVNPSEPTPARPTWVRHEVLLLLTLAAAIAYLTRNAVSVAESTIRDDVGFSIRQSGWLMSAFFWCYAALQVPCGTVASRFGSKLAMLVFVAMGSFAALLIGGAPVFWLLLVAQVLMGAAQAGMFPVSCFSLSHWVPLAHRSFACGMLAAGMQVGAIVAALSTGSLMEAMDWRWVFVLFAVPGFLWLWVFWLSFRNRPEQHPYVNDEELALIRADGSNDVGPENPPIPWDKILLNVSLWFLCGQQMCRAAGYMFFASWFPTFLQKTQGVSVKDSGYLQALVYAGSLAGALFGGMLTDWIWRRTGSVKLSRNGVGAAFLLGCALLILSAWFVKSTLLAVLLLSVGALFASMAGPCALAATIDIGGKHVPQVYGSMNMAGNFAAASCPILVAELFSWSSNWTIVLLVFALIYLMGACCWVMVDCDQRIVGHGEVGLEKR